MTYVESARQIFRRVEVRVIVLAVIVGQALASAIAHLIGLIANTVQLVIHPNFPMDIDWSTALKANALSALISVVLWLVTAGAAVVILARVLRLTDVRGESAN